MGPFNSLLILLFKIFLLSLFLTESAEAAENNDIEDQFQRAASKGRSWILYKWKSLNIQFPSKEVKSQLLASGMYIPKNNVMGGVRVYKNKIYVTISCFRPGVPVTLTVMNYDPTVKYTIKNPQLTPYPSYAFQEIGNCSALQFVQQIEIDQFGRMWVIDTGRLDIMTNQPRNLCPPKLLIIDLNTNQVIKCHEFPPNVAPPTKTALNDIAVACRSPTLCYAFITNSGEHLLTIYDFGNDKSWSVSHPSMKPDPNAEILTILGKPVKLPLGIDGIAISPFSSNFDVVYYSPLASYHLYSVSTKSLLEAGGNGGTAPLQDAHIRDHGVKQSQADGMTMDSAGNMYYGRQNKNAVISWNSQSYIVNSSTEKEIAQSNANLEFISSFAFADPGGLLVTSTRLNRFLQGEYDLREYNFRILRFTAANTTFKSYMYPN